MEEVRSAKQYELWESIAGGWSFFVADSHHHQHLEPDAKLVWTVDAVSYADARWKLNVYMGWEPYEPPQEFADYLNQIY
jgi:hypothetical protein